MVSFSLPAYNEEASIAATLERILATDYPADRRQVLVVSDASTDRTDEIVRASRRAASSCCACPERRGKTAAENAARPAPQGRDRGQHRRLGAHPSATASSR